MTGKIIIEARDGGVAVSAEMQDVGTSDKGFLMHALARSLEMSLRDLSEFLMIETILRKESDNEDRCIRN